MDKMKIIAALPAYNEEVAIGSVVLRAKKHVDKVIVVDDGSTDRTKEVAELAGAVVFRHESNAGYGAAIRSCFQKAKELDAGILVILDADGQHDADEIPQLLKSINEGADIAIGSRFIASENFSNNIPAYRRLGMKILNIVTNAGSKNKVSDSQSGFRAYSKKAINSLRFSSAGTGMGVGSGILLQAQDLGLRIAERPISCRYDIEGSTQGPLRHGMSVLVSIVRFVGRRHALTFFGIPGLILLVAGVCLGLWVVNTYNNTHALAVGNALLTVLFILSGIFAIFTGVLLYTVSSILQETFSDGMKR